MSAQIIQLPQLISRDDAAAALGIRPQTLACWACNGRYDLPFVKIGRRVMYRLSDIEAFIEANLIRQEAA
ncbi:helix-turn-helix domain-containing protein [Denitromonas ohlonensis]|uniref:Helix-turn-helix domain-containing protein n=2 Tax=Denitromonas TaxID=139331 RepID=A0A557S4M3_9RHOO|nr:helix-turn-helix domain-containing protein [Denitromonas ohlonensis]TVO60557.1 helix-turn-helix domain-containing protein [Denitromonas ohlonensis]TVO72287.1 helix-turn-helix domain-containing protein [Denitromonas ohlonensis]